MQAQPEPRYKKRLPCRLTQRSRAYSGMVLDISRTGLFVQTGADAKPGESLEVKLNSGLNESEIPVTARVVWKRQVPHQLRRISEGGLGLQVHHAPESYYSLLAQIARVMTPGPRSVKERTTTEGDAPRPKFRFRIKQESGPRSRTIEVSGDSEEDARSRLMAQLGGGWLVVEVDGRS